MKNQPIIPFKTAKFQLLALGVGALVLAGAISSRATLLVYEGFNYTAGSSLTNASDGFAGDSFGWSGRWYGASNPLGTNISGSLGYTDLYGNSLATDGGSLVAGNLGGSTINAQPTRSFNIGALNAAGNIYSGLSNGVGGVSTYWVSYTMQWIGYPTPSSMSTSNAFWRKGDIAFRSASQTNGTSSGVERLDVGRPNANSFPGTPVDTWTIWTNGDGGAALSSVPTTAPLTNATFVLLRLEVDGDTNTMDKAYMWLNWTNLALEPLLGLASATNSAQMTGLNNIRLDANNQNGSGTNTVLQFDEFRLGDAFGDVSVVPEPTILALAAIGGVAFLVRKRIRSKK